MAEQELYEIVTDAATYRYTSSSAAIVRNLETYTAVAIRRDRLVETDDLNQAALSIYAAYTLPYAAAARVRPLAATLTILAYNTGTALWDVVWKGRVMAVNHRGLEVEIATESLVTVARRLGAFPTYQLLCRHVLYGARCAAMAASFSYTGAITDVTGLQLTIPGAAGAVDGFYTGGYVVFASGDYRTITAHVGTLVTIYASSEGLAAGQDATIYAGCDHTMATCRTKFSNLVNFGGFHWIPPKEADPFDMSHHGIINYPNPF